MIFIKNNLQTTISKIRSSVMTLPPHINLNSSENMFTPISRIALGILKVPPSVAVGKKKVLIDDNRPEYSNGFKV